MALTTEQYRKLLGKTGKKLTDAQVIELKNLAIVLADLAIESYLVKRGAQKRCNEYGNAKQQ